MMQSVLNIQSFLEYNGMTLIVFVLGVLVGQKVVSYIIEKRESK
jgi:hypothetical protein